MSKVIGLVIFLSCIGAAAARGHGAHQPNVIKDDAVVRVVTKTSSARVATTRKISVKETLKNLNATCGKEKLVDKSGRPIRFSTLQGCWGDPPAAAASSNPWPALCRLQQL